MLRSGDSGLRFWAALQFSFGLRSQVDVRSGPQPERGAANSNRFGRADESGGDPGVEGLPGYANHASGLERGEKLSHSVGSLAIT